jgi:hypothetical protein
VALDVPVHARGKGSHDPLEQRRERVQTSTGFAEVIELRHVEVILDT